MESLANYCVTFGITAYLSAVSYWGIGVLCGDWGL